LQTDRYRNDTGHQTPCTVHRFQHQNITCHDNFVAWQVKTIILQQFTERKKSEAIKLVHQVCTLNLTVEINFNERNKIGIAYYSTTTTVTRRDTLCLINVSVGP